jgi:transcriptional regulator with XRE-family HTH domain
MGTADLGKHVKAARLERGTGLRELARQAGIAPAFVTDIEAGRRMPSAEVLARIAAALSIPLAELQDLDPRVTPEVRKWMEAEPRVSSLLQRLEGHRGRDALLARMEHLIDNSTEKEQQS